jgi:hypothetical protein
VCVPTDRGPSERIEQFVLEHLDSIGKLEVLLLVAREPGRAWTAVAASDELRTSEPSAARHLAELARQGLVAPEPGTPPAFRFAPATPDLAALVDELVTAFPTWSTRITRLIYERPVQRLRELADAFRLRRDADDG